MKLIEPNVCSTKDIRKLVGKNNIERSAVKKFRLCQLDIYRNIQRTQTLDFSQYYFSTFQAQLVVLAFQVSWSENVEHLLSQEKHVDLQPALRQIESTLGILADLVLADQPTVRRRKLEHLVKMKRNEKRFYGLDQSFRSLNTFTNVM